MKRIICLFVLMFGLWQSVNGATIRVTSFDGAGCNLVEAIRMANADDATGNSCANHYNGALGNDIILLQREAHGNWFYFASYPIGGTGTALPPITSKVLIQSADGIEAITIYQNPHIVQRLQAFDVYPSGDLTLRNIKFIGFNAGVISNSGALNIEDCEFSSNASSSLGFVEDGGVINSRSKLKISRSLFYGNRTDGVGGAISLIGVDSKNETTILDSTFSSNKAKIGGGAIDVNFRANSNSYLSILNSTFVGNRSYPNGSGGAIWFTAWQESGDINPTSKFRIVNNIFTENNASAGRDLYTGESIGNTEVVTNETLTAYNNLVGNSSYDSASGLGNIQIYDGVAGNILAYSNNRNIVLSNIIGSLGNHGGKTRVYPLVRNSPAINAGTPGFWGAQGGSPFTRYFWERGCASYNIFQGLVYRKDQRYMSRPKGVSCDIGAFEARGYISW